jgi:hypothetical protein
VIIIIIINQTYHIYLKVSFQELSDRVHMHLTPIQLQDQHSSFHLGKRSNFIAFASTFLLTIHTISYFHCYVYYKCFQYRAYAMVQMVHNDSVVHQWQSCNTVLHTVNNVSYSAEGRYTCRVLDDSNHVCDRPLGNLSVIGKCLSQ